MLGLNNRINETDGLGVGPHIIDCLGIENPRFRDAPIGRHPTSDYKFAVVEGGRPSITHYEVLEMFPSASLVEIHLETGRTHQIRVHMAAMRHVLAGDLTYGADPTLARKLGLSRQWLHARELAFEHPTRGGEVRVTSEYPDDLAAALEVLRS